jgi:hypothetical protein
MRMTKQTKREIIEKVLSLLLKLNDLSNEIDEIAEAIDSIGGIIDKIPTTKEEVSK